MASLRLPTTTVHASFIEAIDEERADPHASTINLDHHAVFEEVWHTTAGFAAYVAALHADREESTPRPPTFVPATMLWWVDGPTFIGRVHVRHRLTERLREVGGHIGYVVRPSARRQGHATAMLRAALPWARALGIDDALVTTDIDNVASQRVILANGGRRIEERGGKVHFRIRTDQQPVPAVRATP